MACLLFEHPPWAPGGQAVSVAIRVLAGAPRLAVIQDARRELPRSGFVQRLIPAEVTLRTEPQPRTMTMTMTIKTKLVNASLALFMLGVSASARAEGGA